VRQEVYVAATKIVDNGPDAERLVFVVLGDGYAQADQAKYHSDVQRLVVDGVLVNDVYAENRLAFNVYRADLVSAASGVSTPGQAKDTALKLLYTGKWDSCWIQESGQSDALIRAAARGIGYNFLLLVLNESGFGGCARSHRLYITSGVDWDLVAHEYAHGIAGLYDEYGGKGRYHGPTINDKNCSTVVDRNRVVWRDLIDARTPIPTRPGGAGGPDTVGMFERCKTFDTGIYRPAQNCLMRESGQNPVPPFCPVCRPLMATALSRYLPHPGRPRDGALGVETPTMIPEAERPSGSHLFVELRVSADGGFEVLSAQEMSGSPVFHDAAGDRFAYEVLAGARVLSAEALPEDPFAVRCLPDPAGANPLKYEQAKTAVIAVRIPIAADALDREPVSFRLYKVSASPAGDADAAGPPDGPGRGHKELRLQIPAGRLAPAIAAKLARP
jgi:hypothetical protein